MKYPCPSCGYSVFDEAPGSHEICPVCNWENDASMLRFPSVGGGANGESLINAQKNFDKHKASEEQYKNNVRRPRSKEPRDIDWRKIDLELDNSETPKSGVDYGDSYPKDLTQLYYWRTTFWRLNQT